MQLTIDVKNSAADKILYFLEHLKEDVTIISRSPNSDLNIEVIEENDPDYKYIVQGREERKEHPESYVAEDAIKWD
jgi:hypothetical protein